MIELIPGYYFKVLDNATFFASFHKMRGEVFNDNHDIDIEATLSIEEKKLRDELNMGQDKMFRLNIAIYHKEEWIGWFFGFQKDDEDFYMCNSGIYKEHQNKGIYKALLPHIVSILKEKGFQRIYSRHKASNNAVLVPKLQFGFQISAMEIDPRFGIMVHLSYFTNENRQNSLRYWSGQYRPDEDFKKLMKL